MLLRMLLRMLLAEPGFGVTTSPQAAALRHTERTVREKGWKLTGAEEYILINEVGPPLKRNLKSSFHEGIKIWEGTKPFLMTT